MESKYTATLYNNNQIIKCHAGNDLKKLVITLILQLDGCISGSYGTITDNGLDMIIQRYKKSIIED